MPKRKFSTLEEFKANLHKEGATLVEFSGSKVPCIVLNHKMYEEMLKKVYGKHAWEVEYGERCTTCNKRIDEFGFCACGSSQ